jgi:hypothetical protein
MAEASPTLTISSDDDTNSTEKLDREYDSENDSAQDVGSVSNGSGLPLRVRVWVQTEPLPNWRSGSSINPNCPLGYGSMVNSQPVRIGRVVRRSPSGSIY